MAAHGEVKPRVRNLLLPPEPETGLPPRAANERGFVADLDSADIALFAPAAPKRDMLSPNIAPQPPVAPQQKLPPLHLRMGKQLRAMLRDEADFGTPFVLVPVWMCAGALSYFHLADEPNWLPLLSMAAFCLALAIASRFRPFGVLAAVPLFVLAGMLAAKWETARVGTFMMGSEVTTRITGTIAHAELLDRGRTRIWIDVTATEKPALRYAPQRIRVTARGDHTAAPAGSTVTGLVRLFALAGPVQPGGYDFAFESYFDGIGATGYFLGAPLTGPPGPPENWRQALSQSVDRARAALTAHIIASVPGQAGTIVAALTTGIRGAVSEADNEALRRSGLAHVMSISGLHMALVCGTVLGAIRLGFALFPLVAMRLPVRKIGALVAIVVAVAYCVLSGAEVATVRSTVMIVIMLLAVLFDRPAVTMRNLALAAIIILIWTPHEAAGPGFQMSFAATAALIAVYRLWASRKTAEPVPSRNLAVIALRFAGAAVVGTFISSMAAGLATLPFSAFHFERVAPWGAAANILAFPAISIVVMPALVLGMLALPFGLDGLVWPIAGWGVEQMLLAARIVAAWGGPDATGPVPIAALLMCFAGFALLFLPATRLRLLAIIPLTLAAGLYLIEPKPLAMISEDAGLVAVLTEGGAMAVSRRRANAFTTTDWTRLFQAGSQMAPGQTGKNGQQAGAQSDSGFVCEGLLCRARLLNGIRIAHIVNDTSKTAVTGDAADRLHADLLAQACVSADIIVLERSGPFKRCASPISPVPDKGGAEKANPSYATILTAGMLARSGTAALYADHSQTGATSDVEPVLRQRSLANARADPPHRAAGTRIVWTYDAINRPWQTHRAFSRAARDLSERPAYAGRSAMRDPALRLGR